MRAPMRRAHGRGLGRGLGLGLAVFAASFVAASTAAAADLPSYAELPGGRVSSMPAAKAPAGISAREQVAGFFVVSPKFPPTMPASSRHVTVVASAHTATQIRAGEGVDAEEREEGACFTDTQLDEAEGDQPTSHEWAAAQGWQVNLWPKSKDNDAAGVGAVHREQVVEGNDGRATLESVDAWVDPATRGVRLIGRASLPLVQVGRGLGGVKIYAGREERPGGERYVHYVVMRRQTSASSRLGTMVAMRQDGSNAHGNGCGHLRVPLVVEAHDGDSAVVMAPVELPSAGKREEATTAGAVSRDASGGMAPAAAGTGTSPAAASAGTSPAAAGTSPASAGTSPAAASAGTSAAAPAPAPAPPRLTAAMRRKLGKRGRFVPPAAAPVVVAPAPVPVPVPVPAPEPVEREVRTRDMQIHLGVSQSSRDPHPLLAVSYGWAGREQVQRVTDEPGGRE